MWSMQDFARLIGLLIVFHLPSLSRCQSAGLNVGVLASFESPALAAESWSYSYQSPLSGLLSAAQPWTFCYTCGIATNNSLWSASTPPPDGVQYAFMQTPPGNRTATISATLLGLSANTYYSLQFWYAVRAYQAENVNSGENLFVSVDGMLVFSTNYINDPQGWIQQASALFTTQPATPTTAQLLITVVKAADIDVTMDYSVLIDAVSVSTNAQQTLSAASSQLSTLYSFETPSVGSGSWSYSFASPLSSSYPTSQLPFLFVGLGGIAASGSPWDPPGAAATPDGSQYVYVQMAPDNVYSSQSSILTTLTGLSSGTQYAVTFYYAMRNNNVTVGAPSNDMVAVVVSGQTIWSVANVLVQNGWTYVVAPFTASATSHTVQFIISESVYSDHAWLLDAIRFVPASQLQSSSSASPVAPSSSATPVLSSSSASPALSSSTGSASSGGPIGLTFGGAVQSFESPALAAESWSYSYQSPLSGLLSAAQPWTFCYTCGIATNNSLWSASTPPPDGVQYAFMQTPPGNRTATISATLLGLSANTYYSLQFWYAVRAYQAENVNSGENLFVSVDGMLVFSTNYINDPQGWIQQASALFTTQPATPTTAQLLITVVKAADIDVTMDYSVLIDAVSVSTNAQQTLSAASSQLSTLYSFETPSVGSGSWSYSFASPLSSSYPTSQLPFLFVGLGGIAASGSPWDPPGAAATPDGSQYVYVQMAPDNVYSSQSSILTTLTGLSSGTQYAVTFYYAMRNNNVTVGAPSNDMVAVVVSGQTIWSVANVLVQNGWTYVVAPFTASATSHTVQFIISESVYSDHAWLLDAIRFVPASQLQSSSSASPVAPSSSATPVLSSSSASPALSSSTGSASSGGPIGLTFGGAVQSFESPALAAESWSYSYQSPLSGLLSAAQPWTFCYTCGIATNNSLWSASTPPPDGVQYAFMQTPPGNRTATISATLLGLSANTYYSLQFWYAVRAYQAENVNSGENLFVSVDGMLVFSTNYINDPQGWIQQASALFTTQPATPTTAQLLITVVKAADIDVTMDYSVLIDAVSVSTNAQQTLSAASSQLSTLYSFETPSVGSGSWSYSFASPLSSSYPTSQLPFLFVGLGGIAASGSPWDPPGAAATPDGSQYVYVQMAPDNVYSSQSSILTTLTGLSSGTQYAVTFYYAMRNNNVTVGAPSNDMVAVVVSGQTIWSVANVLVQNGWTYVVAPFTASATSHTVQFIISESVYSDHAWLLDAIRFVPASQLQSSSSASPVAPSSSATPVLSSSSASPALSSSTGSASSGGPIGLTFGGAVQSFESPALAAESWSYSYQSPLSGLLSAAQPWTFCYTCGIATNNSLWSASTPPPDGVQYAFMQTPPGNRTATISATLLGLSANTYYSLQFWYAVRAYQAENVNSGENLFVSVDGMLVFSTNYINDPQGWIQQASALFTTQPATPTTAQLLITVVKAADIDVTMDYSVLIDAVSVSTNAQQTLSAASSQLSTLYSFETPSVGSGSWSYSFASPLSSSYPTSQLPFLFVGLGGIAASGSPWDPPGAAATPDGSQYVYVQMAPDNVYSSQSSILTTLTGLSSGTQYAVTFYYAMRNNNVTVGAPSNDMVAVVVSGQTIWSVANVLVQNGWTYVVAPFTASATSHTVQFIISESVYSDHAWLLDAIRFVPASQLQSSSSASPVAPSSSATPVLSSSSASPALSSSTGSASSGGPIGLTFGGAVQSFESPALAAESWSYSYQSPLSSLLSAAQPWTFCYTCGIATNNSLWSASTPPPDGVQYAFMQTPPGNRTATISATLLGLSANTYYSLQFWYAVRAYQAENVNSGENLFVSVDGMLVFSTNYINDPQGWIQQASALFTTQPATPTTAQLLITVVKAADIDVTMDYSVLIDAVSVSTNAQQTLSAASSQLSTLYSFETPSVGSGSWSYSFASPLSSSYPTSQLPFLFVGLGGIAASGSPWDPPGAAATPDGSQYVYVQMAPDNVYSSQSSILTTLTGLSSGTQYAVTFYYAMRNNNVTVGAPSNDMVAVVVSGQTIWSVANVLVQNGWTYVVAPFTASATSHTVQFIISESVYSDHAWLLDAIRFVPASQLQSSSSASPVAPSSSATPVLSSSSTAAINPGTTLSSSSSSLSGGAIAGIVVGCVVGGLLLLLIIRCCFVMLGGRKHAKMDEPYANPATEHGDTSHSDDEVEMSTHTA